MDTEFEIFMGNIVWLRKQNKLSKKKMAQLMGIGVRSLMKIENGEMPERLPIGVYFNIHRHFGIPPKDQLQKPLGEEV